MPCVDQAGGKERFSDEERDVVAEMFNVGMGQAGAALSDMLGEGVLLSVPRIEIAPVDRVSEYWGSRHGGQLCGVRQPFGCLHGQGTAVVMFSEEHSLRLVLTLLKRADLVLDLEDVEEEALKEVGNVLLNACQGGLSAFTKLELEISPAEFERGHRLGFLMSGSKREDAVMLLLIRLEMSSRQIEGQVAFTLSREALRLLVADALRNQLE